MTTQTIPSSATFVLQLAKVIGGKCPPAMKDVECEFSYNWDFNRNMGLAHLVSVGGTRVDITLHPLGISGALDFMSDIPPTTIMVNGESVVLYRVILDINENDGARAAALMLGEDGSCIDATENWNEQRAAGLPTA